MVEETVIKCEKDLAEESLNLRVENLERKVARIETRLRKKVEERKLDLKEKFRLHDRAQRLLMEFEAQRHFWKYEEMKKLVKNLVDLVDVALGVKFP